MSRCVTKGQGRRSYYQSFHNSENLFTLVNKHYDYRTGLLGAVIMGCIVYWINADHGFWAAIPAALKQAAYTAIAGGILTRICERMAYYYKNISFALFMGSMVPSVIAVILTYCVHLIKGTPEPFNSTIPTMILAPISFLYWGWRMRRQRDKAEKLIRDTDPVDLAGMAESAGAD